MLNNISIVLVETSHPGNIGAAARALKTMGLKRLVLVNPKEFPSTHAFARAAGAVEVLENAVVVNTLEEALASMHWVVGTSARNRTFSLPMLNPKSLAQQVHERYRLFNSENATNQEEIAIVFGRESSGLSNEELMRCHAHVSIPANPDYSALNLAAAIQIIAYEIYELSLSSAKLKEERDLTREAPLASGDEMEGLYQHLEHTMAQLGILNPDHPRLLMKRLRRLYGRAQLDVQELNILRGMLSAINKKIAGFMGS